MKVHGVILSPNVRKVLVALVAKGLEYESVSLLPGDSSPEFRKISPLGMIPAIEDGDTAVPDSAIIMQYIDEKHPDNPIMPTILEDRAKARWYMEYSGAAVFPCCAPIFQQRVVNRYFQNKPTDEDIVEHAINELFPPVLDYLESQVPDEGFLFGELGAADIAIVSPIINAEYGEFVIDENRWPKMATYMKRAKAHPAFVKCLEKEAVFRQAIISGAITIENAASNG